jgi:outer membrane protein TolC
VDVARGQLIAGDEQLRRTREALGVALGIDSEVGVPADFSLEGLANEARLACKGISWEQRSDLQAQRANVQSATESRKQAIMGYVPSLGLTSNLLGFTTDPGFARFATWNVAAMISMPIWEGGTREGLVTERRGAENQAEAAMELARRQVRLEVEQVRRQVNVAESLMKTARDARAGAAQLDQLTRRAFEVGRGSSLELVQSAVALRQADVVLAAREFELVQARLDVLMTEARCDW